VDRLWLEDGYQEADLRRRSENRDGDLLWSLANSLLRRLTFADTAALPEPRSKDDVIERVSRIAWTGAFEDQDLERDKRWAEMISARSASLHGGWIAVVVGWAHANPEGDPGRLYGLLSARGFTVHSMCLGFSTRRTRQE
jgi:hypothetical protein